MTNPLILQLQVEKSKQEKLLKDVGIKIMRLMHELSALSCPYYTDIEEIKAEEIRQIGAELLKAKDDAKEALKKIKEINKDLGND